MEARREIEDHNSNLETAVNIGGGLDHERKFSVCVQLVTLLSDKFVGRVLARRLDKVCPLFVILALSV